MKMSFEFHPSEWICPDDETARVRNDKGTKNRLSGNLNPRIFHIFEKNLRIVCIIYLFIIWILFRPILKEFENSTYLFHANRGCRCPRKTIRKNAVTSPHGFLLQEKMRKRRNPRYRLVVLSSTARVNAALRYDPAILLRLQTFC